MKKTGAEIMWECMVREGVEVVFGYPGGFIEKLSWKLDMFNNMT